MNGRRVGILAIVAALVALAQGAFGGEPLRRDSTPGGQTRPDFSGDWKLNAKASDDPREKMREAMQASHQGASGGGGMGRGGGGMGRGGGGKGRGGGMGDMGSMGRMSGSAAEFSAQLIPAQALRITHEDPMLVIADENERSQRLYTDFRGGSVSAGGGLEQRVSVAGWEGPALVVETTMVGKKLVQEYEIDKASGQLLVTTQAQVSTAPRVSYRLVYDPVSPGAGMRSPAGKPADADRTGSWDGMNQ